jgi:hypothetical protein
VTKKNEISFFSEDVERQYEKLEIHGIPYKKAFWCFDLLI